MSHYGSLERWIARALSRFPRCKQLLKELYSRIVYLPARKPQKMSAVADVEPVLTNSLQRHSSFFGYYDKSPENRLGYTLAHCVSSDTKDTPNPGTKARISVLGSHGKVHINVPTSAYNWQQGARAQWLSDDLFIFNDYDATNKRYVARVYSVSTEAEVNRFDYPVQDAFGADYFLSLNYRRLLALRPDYGYRNLPTLDDSELAQVDTDGIWRVEYETGHAKLLVSLRVACELGTLPDASEGGRHLFNHAMISPSGAAFVFLHRVFSGDRRSDRLLLADSKSGELSILADYGMVSHCFWIDDTTVLGYMRGPDAVDGYWLIDVNSGQFRRFGEESMLGYGDGHPHVHGDWFVTDTYPDKARMQHLLLCNWKTGAVKEIAEVFHGFEFKGESRCDLHPRISLDGQHVFFDSVFSGQRQLYRMKLPA